MMSAAGELPYSILIADSDAGCRAALQDILVPEGYEAVLAASGEEALDIIQERRVDLAFLDMHMPTMTGIETLQMVHLRQALMPCILVTADADEGVIRQAFKARAYSVIPKPVSKHVVLYTMVRALARVYGTASGFSG